MTAFHALRADFARRADAAGLVDVAYAEVDSPVGRILAAATPAGVVRLAYETSEARDAVLARLAATVSPRVVEAPARLDAVRRELDEYFTGRRRGFSVPVDLQLVSGPFGRRVLETATSIPYGEWLSYGEIAERAGSPRGARAAGNALGSNPVPIVVPCHRIRHAGGGIGGYTGGLEIKRALLAIEAGQHELPA
jgi:methylated-DNA-[protein]-cysteine S-methyltransferase